MYTLVDSSFESDTESVEGGFPADDPAGPAFAGRVERTDSEVHAFEGGLLVREMASRPDGATDPCVERFDGVGIGYDSGDTSVRFGTGR